MKKFNYYVTHSGKQFQIVNITEDDICLDDIAHHLTNECRYGGALELKDHYSVAQHSILLSNYALQKLQNYDLARYLLMHDASEAYLRDMPSGIKQYLPDYKKLEAKVQKCIERKYFIKTPGRLKFYAKYLDTCILFDEARAFTKQHYDLFVADVEHDDTIKPLDLNIQNNERIETIKEQTKKVFLQCCKALDITDDIAKETLR